MRHVFELIPVILAVLAAVTCSISFSRDRRKHDRLAKVLATLASVLLVFAQTSWWVSSVIQHNIQGLELANAIWTIFNTLVCFVFLLISWPRIKRNG